jgi:hypothetical protein
MPQNRRIIYIEKSEKRMLKTKFHHHAVHAQKKRRRFFNCNYLNIWAGPDLAKRL